MPIVRIAGVFVGLLLLASCANQQFTTEHCRSLDLVQLAQDHASQGLASEVSSLSEHCSSMGIEIDKSEYELAYQREKENFCATTQAFSYGLSGASYEGICDAAFQSDYSLGKGIFDNKYEIWKTQNRIDLLQREIDLRMLDGNGSRSSFVEKSRREIRELKFQMGALRLKLYELRGLAAEKGLSIDQD